MRGFWVVAFLLFWGLAGHRVHSQEDTKPADGDDEPITGGVEYTPQRGLDDKLRDPFKSPFELEAEEREQAERERQAGLEVDRLEYNISELELKGIYLQARTGYWAIFRIGDDYKWYQVGEKFRDGDLTNITDDAVIFKHFAAEDATQVRDIVKELRRDEE